MSGNTEPRRIEGWEIERDGLVNSDFVAADDYDALAAENERLRQQIKDGIVIANAARGSDCEWPHRCNCAGCRIRETLEGAKR